MLYQRLALLAGLCAVKEVARVELNAAKVGEHLKLPAARRVVCLRRGAVSLAQAEVVVIAPVLDELRVVLSYIPADELRLPEIKGRALDGAYLAGRDAALVGRCEGVGVYHQLVAEDIALARKVEISMICHIYDRLFIADGVIIYLQRVILKEGEGHLEIDVAGEAHSAVGAVIAHFEAVVVGDERLPHGVRKLGAAVEAGDAVFIFLDLIFNAVYCEAAVCEAVSISADGHALIIGVFLVPLDRVEADEHICEFAVPVGHKDAVYRGAVGDDIHRRFARIPESEYIDLPAVGGNAERISDYHYSVPFHC